MKEKSDHGTVNYQQMPVIHQQVAGIDIGSKFHVVAVGDNPKTDVKEFGVSTKALFEIALFLKENGIQHVAMEATGGYERPLVSVLQQEGFEVLVTAGANTKNYRRFKSDVSDAIHIRTLHQLGLLPPFSSRTSLLLPFGRWYECAKASLKMGPTTSGTSKRRFG